MAQKEHIQKLVVKYLEGSLSKHEFTELLAYFDIDASLIDAENILLQAITEANLIPTLSDETITQVTDAVQQRLHSTLAPKKSPRIYKWLPYAAAALLLTAGYFTYQNYKVQNIPNKIAVNQGQQDVPPGTNRATIILSNGTEIPLDTTQTGITATENGISYTDGRHIAQTGDAEQITVKIPNAGQYMLILPDSTKVWLNAGTTFSYPSRFSGNERLVNLQGEAYFQVAHNIAKPFKVNTSRQQIKVLGTQFNLSAYTDDLFAATTLAQGAVLVTDIQTKHQYTMKPGQQAISTRHGLEVVSADPEIYSAWKDGYFVFDGENLGHILQQLGRWYNVEVDYTGVPQRTLSAKISRDKNISSVLTAISNTTGLKFYVQERRLKLRD